MASRARGFFSEDILIQGRVSRYFFSITTFERQTYKYDCLNLCSGTRTPLVEINEWEFEEGETILLLQGELQESTLFKRFVER